MLLHNLVILAFERALLGVSTMLPFALERPVA